MLRIYLPAYPHYVLSELPALVTVLPPDTTHCDVFSLTTSIWITLDLESAHSVDSGATEVCLRLSGLSDQDCLMLSISSSKRPRSPSPLPCPSSPQPPTKRVKLHDSVSASLSEPGLVMPVAGPSVRIPSATQPSFPSGFSFSAVWQFVKEADALRRNLRLHVIAALEKNPCGISCKKANFNNIKKLLCRGDTKLWDRYHASGADFSAYRAEVGNLPDNCSVLPWSVSAHSQELSGMFFRIFIFVLM